MSSTPSCTASCTAEALPLRMLQMRCSRCGCCRCGAPAADAADPRVQHRHPQLRAVVLGPGSPTTSLAQHRAAFLAAGGRLEAWRGQVLELALPGQGVKHCVQFWVDEALDAMPFYAEAVRQRLSALQLRAGERGPYNRLRNLINRCPQNAYNPAQHGRTFLAAVDPKRFPRLRALVDQQYISGYSSSTAARQQGRRLNDLYHTVEDVRVWITAAQSIHGPDMDPPSQPQPRAAAAPARVMAAAA
jgi:hypothetical protein